MTLKTKHLLFPSQPKIKQTSDSPSNLQKMIDLLTFAFSSLQSPISSSQIEALSILIHDVMSSRWRSYHTTDHIFDLCFKQGKRDTTPIETLAIAFHDCVYVQTDRRIHPLLSPYLSDFEINANDDLILPPFNLSETHLNWVLYEIFGYQAGMKLTPLTGLNEFLSAAVAMNSLKPFLKEEELVQLMACIEATIPFRGLNPMGETAPEQLLTRLKKIAQFGNNPFRCKPHLMKNFFQQTVIQSVRVSNKDLGSFAQKRISVFFNHTWQLILEGNPIFKSHLYGITAYRSALEKMATFYKALNPRLIFKIYTGKRRKVPSDRQHQQMTSQAASHLKNALEYLQVNILSFGLLEAIAEMTGGPAPLVLMMGEVPHENNPSPQRLENFLDFSISPCPLSHLNPIVLTLLEEGRTGAPDFDIKTSQLSAYVYTRLGKQKVLDSLTFANQYFSGSLGALLFLKQLPMPLVASILFAASCIVTGRKKALLDLRSQFIDVKRKTQKIKKLSIQPIIQPIQVRKNNSSQDKKTKKRFENPFSPSRLTLFCWVIFA